MACMPAGPGCSLSSRQTGAGLAAATGMMADRACCEQHRSNTGPGVRKINTPITRTRRHSAAHGGTIARMSLYAH